MLANQQRLSASDEEGESEGSETLKQPPYLPASYLPAPNGDSEIRSLTDYDAALNLGSHFPLHLVFMCPKTFTSNKNKNVTFTKLYKTIMNMDMVNGVCVDTEECTIPFIFLVPRRLPGWSCNLIATKLPTHSHPVLLPLDLENRIVEIAGLNVGDIDYSEYYCDYSEYDYSSHTIMP